MDYSLRERVLHIIQKPNSMIVVIFFQNISKVLTCLPPRGLSSRLWPIYRHGFRM